MVKIFSFDREMSKTIERFHSSGVYMTPIQHLSNLQAISMICIHVTAKGILGFHSATVPQLFLVVQGDGWVRGEDENRIPILTGQAAFWSTGEGHESGSEEGMTAIVLESTELNPEVFMKRIF